MNRGISILLVVLVVLTVGWSSFFVVDERELAIVTQFGEFKQAVDRPGLYFKALSEGLAPVPDVPPEIRAYWRDRAAAIGAENLHRELSDRDPAMAARLPPTDPQRLVRALEVIDATSISLAEW